MEKEIQQKLFDFIGKSQKILIALPEQPDGDTLGSSLAFGAFLKKAGKEVEILCAALDPDNFTFLPHFNDVKKETGLPQNFIISVSTAASKVAEISYHQNPAAVEIFIKAKEGVFTGKDVSFRDDKSGYDMIVCIDTPSLEQLGELYTRNAELFYNTPKVNIDKHIKNENYADINIVDVIAASTAEIIFQLIKSYDANLIDADIATDLLTGIIYETNSFQHPRTTPNSFMHASELVALGANQQEIIRYLFKTKELPVLKLWGRAMARVAALPEKGVFYSMLSSQDLEKSGAKEDDIKKVLREFAVNISDARIIVLAVENGGGLDLYFEASPNIKISEIINHFGGVYLGSTVGKAHIDGVKINDSAKLIENAVESLKVRLGL